MTEQRLQYLLTRYAEKNLTPLEQQEWEELVLSGDRELWFREQLIEILNSQDNGIAETHDWSEVFNKVFEMEKPKSVKRSIVPAHRVHFLRTAWFRYAAAIIIICGIGAYLYTTNKQKEKPLATHQPVPVKDILPGGNKALIRFADGSTIELDSAANGELAVQKGSRVIKKDGQIIYDPNQQGATDVSYNTMQTPRGGTYQLTLPDGSKAWLNAASSITFPTAFIEKERIVSITGEVYFEVVKDKTKPFVVKGETDEIVVLGTSFNVNSYKDEPASKTSLVEGSVKINNRVLFPGEAYSNGIVSKTNLEQDLSWKNGIFNFNGASLPVVLRQLSRWYDIEVVYEGKGTSQKLIGKLPRKLPFSEVVKALQVLKVNFRMEGNTLIVQ